MAHYIIQVFGFQLLFLMIYDLFLKKETFFNWNRAYLLLTLFLSLIIPFIKINSFKGVVPEPLIINLPEVFIGNGTENIGNHEVNNLVIENSVFNWSSIFYIGVIISVLIFLFKLIVLLIKISKNPRTKLNNLTLVELPESNVAFSFFHYIFLGTHLNVNEKEAIIKHEIIHVREMHSFDLLFFEILRIVFWFNPLIYVYQNRMTSLHEFIADEHVTKNHDKREYYQNLLNQVFQTENISFINPFFKQSLIKKRISMLQKSKSKKTHLWKYALIFPLVVGMLVYSACEQENGPENSVLDLSEYSYTINRDKPVSEISKQSREKYALFLEDNTNYVGWILFDGETGDANYSIHSKDENVPDGYIGVDSPFSNGNNMFVKFINTHKVKGPSKKNREDFKDENGVPFSIVDRAPVFPGCENLANTERKKCFSQSISKYVNQNFSTQIAEELNLKGRQRINVIFKINKNGFVEDVRARAPKEELEDEAIRVIKTIPKLIPGEHYDHKVGVFYSLPIIFQVSE